MKCRVCIFIILLLVPLGASAGDFESVANGDFEKQDSGSLAGWAPSRAIQPLVPNSDAGTENVYLRFVWDGVSHARGKGSLRLDGKGLQQGGKSDTASGTVTGPVNQLLVQPDTEYKLTWFFKARGLSKKTKMMTSMFVQSPGPLGPPPGGSRFLAMKSHEQTKDANDWQQGSIEFKTPKDAGWVQVRLEASSADPQKKFSVWWDDFELARADGNPVANEQPSTWAPRGPMGHADALGLDGFELAEPEYPYGSRIQRTMRLLATSTPQQRNQVKILFYGQSIIAQNWWKAIIADLRERFPNADIIATNPSIGGFQSNWLKDTMFADAYPANADLICFHDYGTADRSELEEIFANLHHLTTAEVMPFTHHVARPKAWSRKQDRESSFIKELAEQHGFEVVDIRTNWKRYLEFSKSEPGDFLKDAVHLAPNGEMLWAKFALPHFQCRPDAKPDWRERITVFTPDGKRFIAAGTEYPSGGKLLQRLLKFSFEGNRVDILSNPTPGAKLGTAKILIDGKRPSAFRELYYSTIGTRPPDFFWPMIRRVEVGKNPLLEDWKITFKNIRDDGANFEYEVTGSITGPDGAGNAQDRFVSRSGRLIIDPKWFMIAPLMKIARKGKPYPQGTTCTVTIRPNHLDVWKPVLPANTASEDRYTLASGLSNGPHTLEIIPNQDGDLPLRAIVVHRP